DAWVESRPIDGAGVMGYCSISAWRASPDLGRCHYAHQTRPEKPGAAQGLTKHNCICQVEVWIKTGKEMTPQRRKVRQVRRKRKPFFLCALGILAGKKILI